MSCPHWNRYKKPIASGDSERVKFSCPEMLRHRLLAPRQPPTAPRGLPTGPAPRQPPTAPRGRPSSTARRNGENFTIASLQIGVDARLPVSPLSFDIQRFPGIMNVSNAQVLRWQSEAEKWFHHRFGVEFSSGFGPKNNDHLSLVPTSVQESYAAWSIYDSTGTLPNDPSGVNVNLVEFVVQVRPEAPTLFRYGGTFAKENFPEDCVARIGDSISYSIYDLHKGTEAVRVKARTYQVTRARSILTGQFINIASLTQLHSNAWGPGLGSLQVVYPIEDKLEHYFFSKNMRFPAPTGFSRLTPWDGF